MPKLPEINSTVEIEVRDGKDKPSRKLAVHLVYPRNKLSNVNSQTGIILTLHNWGGTIWDNTPNPNLLADQYNLVSLGVTYYQSGDKGDDPEPYDFGYIQAMDALRALHYVYKGLQKNKHPFDPTRIYCTGGSGGGNVTLMANKFAPNTFACIVDLSGMASLTDDIAYNLPGGSGPKARYSRDPASAAWLSPDMQEIRDLGHPAHLALQARHENRTKIVVIHGQDDHSCLASDKRRVVDAMQSVGLDVDPHFITQADVDGKIILNSGHQIGERTALLEHFAGKYLSLNSGHLRRLTKPNDFERRSVISYPTRTGEHTISFAGDVPVLTFLTPAKP
jgi:predicted esterase